jgi:hypothetical protein
MLAYFLERLSDDERCFVAAENTGGGKRDLLQGLGGCEFASLGSAMLIACRLA